MRSRTVLSTLLPWKAWTGMRVLTITDSLLISLKKKKKFIASSTFCRRHLRSKWKTIHFTISHTLHQWPLLPFHTIKRSHRPLETSSLIATIFFFKVYHSHALFIFLFSSSFTSAIMFISIKQVATSLCLFLFFMGSFLGCVLLFVTVRSRHHTYRSNIYLGFTSSWRA